jgi:cytidylate kinase
VRTDEAGVDASRVASLPAVRDGLFELQRSFRQSPGLVADGRDMGNVIFPEADVKIYLTASAETRAVRRYNQLIHKDINVNVRSLFKSIQARDERDMNRAVSPLKPAEDAFVIDSTDMDIEEVLRNVEAIVTEKLG